MATLSLAEFFTENISNNENLEKLTKFLNLLFSTATTKTEALEILNGVDKDGKTLLNYASSLGFANVVSVLISFGADVDKPDLKQNTPIISAAFFNRLEVVDKLLRAGADIAKLNNNSWGALY